MSIEGKRLRKDEKRMLSDAMRSSTIPMLEQVANFSESRHTVLAGNLANIDTPGYRTRDLSPEKFQARLIEAIAERNQASQTSMSPGSMSPGSSSPFADSYDPVAHVGTSIDGMLYHDNNNRGLEQEVAAMTDNETQHSMALALLASQLKLLEAAVTEKA
jgi:flagellar basal-body rod protein FlgB